MANNIKQMNGIVRLIKEQVNTGCETAEAKKDFYVTISKDEQNARIVITPNNKRILYSVTIRKINAICEAYGASGYIAINLDGVLQMVISTWVYKDE